MGVLGLLYLILLLSPVIRRLIGELPLDLTARVFGLVLIAISFQFMVDGLTTVFPGWVSG